jgi:hypothetical protein
VAVSRCTAAFHAPVAEEAMHWEQSFTYTHSQFFDEAARDSHAYGWYGSFDKPEAM